MATPSPSPYPNPTPYYQHPGYNHPPSPAMLAPYDHRHRVDHPVGHWVGGRCPMMPRPAPYVEHQKAVTCMCSGCAKVLRFQTNRCPICRQPVDRLLEIQVDNAPDE